MVQWNGLIKSRSIWQGYIIGKTERRYPSSNYYVLHASFDSGSHPLHDVRPAKADYSTLWNIDCKKKFKLNAKRGTAGCVRGRPSIAQGSR